jgi:hypothetical protein
MAVATHSWVFVTNTIVNAYGDRYLSDLCHILVAVCPDELEDKRELSQRS